MYSESFSKFEKYITFPLMSYWCVVPVTEILKIVNCPSPNQGGMIEFGVVRLGPHTVQLLDLYQIFEGEPRPKTSISSRFLIVLQPKNAVLHGILLETPPDLIELPLTVLKPVSLDENTAQSPLISHVGVFSRQDDKRTFLQLDFAMILQQTSAQNHQSMSLAN